MRFVCDGKAYDTNTMELLKLDDFATAIYLDHGAGEAFLQSWDDALGVRICRMTDEEIRKLKDRFGWGQPRVTERPRPPGHLWMFSGEAAGRERRLEAMRRGRAY